MVFWKEKRCIAAVCMAVLCVLALGRSPLYATPGQPQSETKSEAVSVQDPLEVERQIGILDAKLELLGTEIQNAMLDLGSKEAEIIDNANKLNHAKRELAKVRATYNERMVKIYKHGKIEPLRFFLDTADFGELVATTCFLVYIGEHDAELIRKITRLKSEIKVRQARLQVATIQQKKLIDNLELTRGKLMAVLSEERTFLSRLSQESTFTATAVPVEVGGLVFPVARPYTYVDSFGAPRMSGTRYSHSHEGTDIMALPWTEAYAIEDGVITKMSHNTLGGISLWLTGDTGDKYYYAHLYGYADNLEVGDRVRAGQVVGFIGDTGNAKGTPHLHFEIHPDGGEAVDPYPILTTIDPTKRVVVSPQEPVAASGD